MRSPFIDSGSVPLHHPVGANPALVDVPRASFARSVQVMSRPWLVP
jgi:hypothetical protein